MLNLLRRLAILALELPIELPLEGRWSRPDAKTLKLYQRGVLTRGELRWKTLGGRFPA